MLAVAATAACKGREGERNSKEGKNRLGWYNIDKNKYINNTKQREETSSQEAGKKKNVFTMHKNRKQKHLHKRRKKRKANTDLNCLWEKNKENYGKTSPGLNPKQENCHWKILQNPRLYSMTKFFNVQHQSF